MRILLLLAILLLPFKAWSADMKVNPDDSYSAAKAMEIEVMRLRMGANPSLDASTTLLEAEDVLRRYRQASLKEREEIKPQFDAIISRLSLQMPR